MSRARSCLLWVVVAMLAAMGTAAFVSWWPMWDLSDQLALVSTLLGGASLVVTVVIPWMLHNFSKEAEKAAQKADERLQGIQAELLNVSRRGRRDELLQQLHTVEESKLFQTLCKEAEGYAGADLRILREAYRQNPLAPLPRRYERERYTPDDVEDYINSLPRRLRERDRQTAATIGSDVANRVEVVHDVDPENMWRVAAAVWEGTEQKAIPQEFFNKLVTEGSWRIAAPLIDQTVNHWDWKNNARGLAVITGVFWGLVGIDRRRSGRSIGDLSEEEDRELQLQMRQSLAALLHHGPLPSLGRMGGRMELFNSGNIPHTLTTLIAWLFLAIGNAVQEDGHLEMRVLESLEGAVSGLRESDDWDGTWGHVDEWNVQTGMLRIRTKCPQLWESLGEEIISATGVKLAPRIEHPFPPQPDPYGFLFGRSSRHFWPEPFEEREGPDGPPS